MSDTLFKARMESPSGESILGGNTGIRIYIYVWLSLLTNDKERRREYRDKFPVPYALCTLYYRKKYFLDFTEITDNAVGI